MLSKKFFIFELVLLFHGSLGVSVCDLVITGTNSSEIENLEMFIQGKLQIMPTMMISDPREVTVNVLVISTVNVN